jgi:hypothetical protein
LDLRDGLRVAGFAVFAGVAGFAGFTGFAAFAGLAGVAGFAVFAGADGVADETPALDSLGATLDDDCFEDMAPFTRRARQKAVGLYLGPSARWLRA